LSVIQNPTTGHRNVFASVCKFVSDQIGQQVQNIQYNQAMDFSTDNPIITASESNIFSLNATAFNNNIGDTSGTVGYDGTFKGQIQQMQVEFNLWVNAINQDNTQKDDALIELERMRDRLRYALNFAGVQNENKTGYLVDPIKLLDFYDTSDVPKDTGHKIWFDFGNASGWNQQYFDNDLNFTNLKRYRIYCIFNWFDLNLNTIVT
jgi:hypothetical protein